MDAPRFRFAPSPTGNLHLGGARTALYNWLAARHMGGQYLLRIEDTDRERSTPEHEAQIMRTLAWMGLGADDDTQIIRQSERGDRYAEVIAQLASTGALYTDETADADEQGRRPMRLKTPESGRIEFSDIVRGEMGFEADSIRDPIVVRSDGRATYNLACAIDDADMQITHVVRGEDHLSNTPLQTLIIQAMGRPVPIYAHLPMILGPDGAKLAKRHGAASVEEYMHYLPESLVHYLSLLGWNPGDGAPALLTRDDLIERFELERVVSSPARFDAQMLDHVQVLHFRSLAEDPAAWKERYPHGDRFDPNVAYELTHDKALTWDDDERLLRPLARPLVMDDDIVFENAHFRLLDAARVKLAGLSELTESSVDAALRELCVEMDLKPRKTLPVIQWAVMGQRRGTSMFRVIPLLGREEALQRIQDAGRPLLERMSFEMRNAQAPDTVDESPERTMLGEIQHGDDIDDPSPDADGPSPDTDDPSRSW